MKLIIQIPCFNEEKTLSSTINDLPLEVEGFNEVELLVIDDGSTDKTFEKAKQLIDTKIWLNNVWDEENFISKFSNAFYVFQSVEVKDVICFQNSDNGHPIWLKVITEKGEDAMVRYNQQGERVGIKDHYFTSDPLPFEWGIKILENIKNRKADIGMSSKQVLIAIGYPDKINSTSSRHGVSEQWIYFLSKKKIYYQFEYDKLVYINH